MIRLSKWKTAAERLRRIKELSRFWKPALKHDIATVEDFRADGAGRRVTRQRHDRGAILLSDAISGNGIICGQLPELKGSGLGSGPFIEDRVAFSGGCAVRRLCCGASRQCARALMHYGDNLDLVFQIWDDVTDKHTHCY